LTPAALAKNEGAPANGKLSPPLAKLAKGGGNEMVDVIVTFEPGSRGASPAAALGGQSRHQFQHFPFEAMTIPARALNGLANNPNVKFVSRDVPVQGLSNSAKATLNKPNYGEPNFYWDGWGITSTRTCGPWKRPTAPCRAV
jgi:hypothetical protein